MQRRGHRREDSLQTSARKFDPARAHLLDSPERERTLPAATLVAWLELSGSETVLDYGAGTGRFTLEVAGKLPNGRVIAIDESPEMMKLLQARTAGQRNVETIPTADNEVPLPDESVDRILAVNLLHEVRGESALAEMRRLLAERGLLIVVDWDRDRPSDSGPPTAHRYSAAEARQELTFAGFDAELLSTTLPHHFALRAHR